MKPDNNIDNLLITIAGIYDRKLDAEGIKIYRRILSGYGITEIKEACDRIIADNNYFPRPSEIVETIKDIRAENRKPPTATAKQEYYRDMDKRAADPDIAKKHLDEIMEKLK